MIWAYDAYPTTTIRMPEWVHPIILTGQDDLGPGPTNMSAGHLLFCRFHGLPALCVCVAAACGASATSEKARLWIFLVCSLWMMSFFNDFRARKPCVSVSQLPAALRRPQKNTPLEFGSMYLVDCCRFLSIFGSLNWYQYMTPYGPIWSQTNPHGPMWSHMDPYGRFWIQDP